MRKRFILLTIVLAQSNEALIAQQNQTGTPPVNINATNNNIVRDLTERAWYRGGNQLGAAAGSNNIFGTLWNSPIYTQTNSVTRSKLNGTLGIAGATQYTINSLGFANGVNTSGYFLIGNNNQVGGPLQPTFYNTRGAFSMLHLNGQSATTAVQEFGYRTWMKTGITLTDNSDLSYFGVRSIDGL